MNTHDVLAFALASEAVRKIRAGDEHWSPLFSSNVYTSLSRSWPVPDFVLVDEDNEIAAAAEFKPPNQSKREYLTGLGQAVAYTRDFHYGLLVLPTRSDDDYRIAQHVVSIVEQDVARGLPLGVLTYDPATISATAAQFEVAIRLERRTGVLVHPATVETSFYAKWRDMSPDEAGTFLHLLFEEGQNDPRDGTTVRDRAFDRLWREMIEGRTVHWGGEGRNLRDTTANKTAWGKNYRNFFIHIGWSAADGRLSEEGLRALRLAHQYHTDSGLFRDHLAKSLLIEGKHLVLFDAVNSYQDNQHTVIDDEGQWLDGLEEHLEANGLLKRNQARHDAADRGVERGFLKAEKTIWKNLGLIVPRGQRVYHPGRGFIFNWSRITALIS